MEKFFKYPGLIVGIIALVSAYGIHIVTHYMEDTRQQTLSVTEHRELVIGLVRNLAC